MEIGPKIRRLRQQLALTQEELGDRCELSKGFISQLERDQASPSIATLVDILECLGCDLQTFFSEKQDRKIVFSQDDVFVKEDDCGTSVSWLVPTAQKNRMEPIIVELAPSAATEADDPHEGEEFGYVLKGQATLVIGDRREKVKKGESFCFEPTAVHKLVNTGQGVCKVLWIATPPSF